MFVIVVVIVPQGINLGIVDMQNSKELHRMVGVSWLFTSHCDSRPSAEKRFNFQSLHLSVLRSLSPDKRTTINAYVHMTSLVPPPQ